LLIIISIIALKSCTILQWRQTDSELKQSFDDKNIPSKISYITIDSLDLNIRVLSVTPKTDENENVSLVFFHGSPSSLSAWNGYLTNDTLYSKYNLHAIDRPGYGYSNFGDAMTSIDKQAQVMSTVVNQLELKNVIAVGASYGGPLALQLAHYNKNIKAAILISPALDPNNEKDIWASRLTQWWITRWLVPTAYREAGDEKVVHAKAIAAIEDDWTSLQIPIIHIHGNTDDIVPYKNIEYSKAKLNTVEIITIDNKGHEIAWKYPELIIPHIFEAIKDIQTHK